MHIPIKQFNKIIHFSHYITVLTGKRKKKKKYQKPAEIRVFHNPT